MSFWPFSKKQPEASDEAKQALTIAQDRLTQADERLHEATRLSCELKKTRQVNHFGLAVQATMRGDTRP